MIYGKGIFSSKIITIASVFATLFLVMIASQQIAYANEATLPKLKAALTEKCGIINKNLTAVNSSTSAGQKNRLNAAKKQCERPQNTAQGAASALIGVCKQANGAQAILKDGTKNYYNGSKGSELGMCARILSSSNDVSAAATGKRSPAGADPAPSPGGGGDTEPANVSPSSDPASDSQPREQNSAPEPVRVKCEAKDGAGNCIDPALAQCWPSGNNERTISQTCNLYVKYINPIIKILSALVGIAVVIGVISGGIRYAASADDPQKAAAGKTQIRGAIIALFVYVFLMAGLQWLVPGGIW